MKKLLAITVTVIMVMLCLVPCAFAAGDSVTVSMVNFNVAGLPNVGSWIGKNDVNVSKIALALGGGGHETEAAFSYGKNLTEIKGILFIVMPSIF